MLDIDPTDQEFIALATSSASLDRSPKKNWVENRGGLPPYIRKIARAIHQKRGIPLDRAIPIAIGKIKDWARGGDDVTAKTRAKAAAALAKWTALKAKGGKKVSLSAEAVLVMSDLTPGKEHLLDTGYRTQFGDGQIIEYREDSVTVEKTDPLTGERSLEVVTYTATEDDLIFGDPTLLEDAEDVELTPDEEESILAEIADYKASQR